MPEAHKYKISRRLPPVVVDKTLLITIEDYLINKLPSYLNIQESDFDIKDGLKIYITEKNGEVTYGSVSHYVYELLPNEIEGIKIIFRIHNRKNAIDIDFTINFSESRFSSRIELGITGANAQALVNGAVSRIDEIIFQKKTINYIFHPKPLAYLIYILVACGLAFYCGVHKNDTKLLTGCLCLQVFLFIYLFVFDKLKPYTAFDTKKQRTNDKIANFFLWGFLGFVIFGSCFEILRKYLLGE